MVANRPVAHISATEVLEAMPVTPSDSSLCARGMVAVRGSIDVARYTQTSSASTEKFLRRERRRKLAFCARSKSVQSGPQGEPRTLDAKNALEQKAYELQRRLEILKQQFEQGKIYIAEGLKVIDSPRSGSLTSGWIH
jgi:hypothetical protein